MKFGDIILIPFPFTDLSSSKLRPALVVSRINTSNDIIVCFITTQNVSHPSVVALKADQKNNLKADSFVRFDKIATLDRHIALGKLGEVNAKWLQTNRDAFLNQFGS